MKFFCLFTLSLFGSVLDHLTPIVSSNLFPTMERIDEIYLINLETRPEKWEFCIRQLQQYGIQPSKVPAINGWNLSPFALNDIGVIYAYEMWPGRESLTHFDEITGELNRWRVEDSTFGRTVFSKWTSKGAIGCSLSHLSVLKDAFEKGYETVWVMEDDISVVENPHILSSLIEELDLLVGKDGWDMLFTDHLVLEGIDPTKDLLEQLPFMWRPDFPFFDLSPMLKIETIGENFQKIGSRMRFHSIIYRRAGMEKILNFYKTHGIFMPFDHEVFFVPDIQPFVIRRPVVCVLETTSDTKTNHFYSN